MACAFRNRHCEQGLQRTPEWGHCLALVIQYRVPGGQSEAVCSEELRRGPSKDVFRELDGLVEGDGRQRRSILGREP